MTPVQYDSLMVAIQSTEILAINIVKVTIIVFALIGFSVVIICAMMGFIHLLNSI